MLKDQESKKIVREYESQKAKGTLKFMSGTTASVTGQPAESLVDRDARHQVND